MNFGLNRIRIAIKIAEAKKDGIKCEIKELLDRFDNRFGEIETLGEVLNQTQQDLDELMSIEEDQERIDELDSIEKELIDKYL